MTAPLTRGKRLAGAFLNLRELAKSGPVVCIFRVVAFHEPEKATGFAGTNVPVTADVLICDGPRKGEVHPGEKFIGAITAPLRGVRNPKGNDAPEAPVNEVGQQVVLRVKLVNEGKTNEGAVGDEPSDSEMDAAGAAYQDGKGWDAVPAQRTTEAAAAGNGKRPW